MAGRKATVGRNVAKGSVDRYEGEVPGTVPTALCQAAIAAMVICVCDLVVSPVYAAILVDADGNVLMPVVPLAAMLALLGVAFVCTVGFVLLWVAGIVSARMGRAGGTWLVYAAAGLIGFGVWGGLVVPSVLNSITAPYGGPAVAGGDLVAVVANAAAVGAVAFSLAAMFADRIRARKGMVIALAAIALIIAAFGAYVMVSVFGRLY